MLNVVAAFIEDEAQNLLLIARRKAGKDLAGYWEFPGGKIEMGETPQECLERELFEEFSIQTEIKEFVGETVYAYSKFTIRLLGYRVKILSGEFCLIDHDKVQWVSLAEIDSFQLAPADIPLLACYRRLFKKQK